MLSLNAFAALTVFLSALAGNVNGTVKQLDGAPAAGAKVIAIRLRPTLANEGRLSVTTNQDGEFSLRDWEQVDGQSEWWIIAVHGKFHGRYDTSITIEKREKEQTNLDESNQEIIEIRLLPGKSITGTVYNEVTRQPIPLAKIFSRQGQLVRTDSNGKFELRGVPSGVEQLLIKSIGKESTFVSVDVSEREKAEVDIFLSPGGIIKGQVLDDHDCPVPKASIERSNSSRIFSAVLSETSDAEGQFEFDGLPLNRLVMPLIVKKKGYEERNDDMFAIRNADLPLEMILRVTKVGENGNRVQLRNRLTGDDSPAVGAIRGKVVDPQGRSIRNFTVQLLPPTPNGLSDTGSWSGGPLSFSEEDGRFVIGCLDATKRYRVAVVSPGFGRSVVEPIYAELNLRLKERDDIEFRLTSPHKLKVVVVDAESKQPIPDVMVGLKDNRRPEPEFCWDLRLHNSRIEWTDSTGIATFEKLAAEAAQLFIDHPGYARLQHYWTEVLSDSPIEDGSELVISLQKEAKLNVRIVKFGHRDPGGLYAEIHSSKSEKYYSQRAKLSDPTTLQSNRILPGPIKLEIFDSQATEPWNALVTREIVLQPGDNQLEIDLPEIGP